MNMESLLSIRNLRVAFGETPVVGGINLDVGKGECLALVGESGSGKSVSAHAVLGLLAKKAQVSGEIHFGGLDLLGVGPAIMRTIRGNRIAMVFQEPMTSLNPLHTVGEQVGEALLLHRGMGARARREKVLGLLENVGIPDSAARIDNYPHQLSGGQRQRVMIAMALACDPDLIIADEPTTALDVVIQERIIDLLNAIRQRRNLSLLIISHDLNVVRRIADRVAVMKAGEIVETGPCETIFRQPRHPYTQMLIAAEPDGTPCAVEESAGPVLRVEGLNVVYKRRKSIFSKPVAFHALKDVSLVLLPGRTLGVVGESGSGKSTLGQAILRLISSSGRIEIDGHAIDGLRAKAIRPWRKQFQIVFQDPYGSLSPFMTVADIIGEGLREHGTLTRAQIDAEVVQALQDVQLDPGVRHRFAHEFSGGQRQRIAIARALVLRPRLIVLDEPTSALDRSVQKQVITLLRALQEKFGLAYLFISHDLAVVRALAHDVIVLRNGTIVERGAASRVLQQPADPYTQTLLAASSLGWQQNGFSAASLQDCIPGDAKSSSPESVVN
jgi:microcin C transport system ATP-binding protein